MKKLQRFLSFGGMSLVSDFSYIGRDLNEIIDQFRKVRFEDSASIDPFERFVDVAAHFIKELDGAGDVAFVFIDEVFDLSGEVETLRDQLIDAGRIDSCDRFFAVKGGGTLVTRGTRCSVRR